MSDTARLLLIKGRSAAKDGDVGSARRCLERALHSDPSDRQRLEAWFWLSEVSDDPEEKRQYLEFILGREPWNPRARRGLAILDSTLDPHDIIDPDRPGTPPAPASAPRPVAARRYVCHQCGGRMTFSPDGRSLTCPYCGHQMDLLEALESGAALEEEDFAVALATARGHSQPVSTSTLTCQGCGASFLLAPEVLSLKCPYCESAYVTELPQKRELIPPQGIIPMALSQEQARQAVLRWLSEQRLAPGTTAGPPTGLYLPAWTFDVGGEVRWRERQAGAFEAIDPLPPLVERSLPIFYNDLLVLASHRLSPRLAEALSCFDLHGLVPYDPRYLAGWPAEVYQIPVADASLVARRRAWEDARRRVLRELVDPDGAGKVTVSSAAIAVISFKLILLPFWLARYRHQGRQYRLAINGQTGSVRGQVPASGLQRLWRRLFG